MKRRVSCEVCVVTCFEQTGRGNGKRGGTENFGRRERGGGIVVGVKGETTVDQDMQTVCPPGHDLGNRRGRHDELCYRSSAPKASAAQGGSVYDRD